MDLRNESRGFRNNNPGNLRHGNKWKGEITGDDRAFESFESIEYGIRAIYVTLNTYRTKYKISKLRDIINRFAPPSENNVTKYIVGVLGYMDKTTAKARKAVEEHGELLDLAELELYDELVAAIIYYENGLNPFNLDFIRLCKNL